MIDALGELPSRCVLRDNGKESARITPYDLTTVRNRAIVRSVAIALRTGTVQVSG
jgi:hypothetical protein